MFGDFALKTAEAERLRKLREALGLLGVDESAIKVSLKVDGTPKVSIKDHVIATLRDGLDITDAEAVELLDELRELILHEEPDDPDDIEEEKQMALKSSKRDHNGYQKADPLGLGLSGNEAQRIVPDRDSRGFRLNKPNDPNRFQRRHSGT